MSYQVLIDDIEKDPAKFLEVHRGDFYGGSDVANICGVGYESPLRVWMRKTGKLKGEELNPQMIYGKLLEPLLRQLLAKKTEREVRPINETWQSKEYPWMIVSPDAFVGENELAELKAHKLYAEKYWANESASDSAMCQLQWALAVSGMEGGYCAAILGGDCEKFYAPHFESNKLLQEQMIEQVEKFRDFVKKDIPPSAGPGDAELIKQYITLDVTEGVIDLTDSCSDLLTEYKELEEEKRLIAPSFKAIEDKIKAIKNTLVSKCEGANQIIVGENKIKISHVVVAPYMNKGSDYFKVTIK